MAIVSVGHPVPPPAVIDAAVREINSGLVIGVPTDTVYGLIADVSYTGAADRLFKLKRRSRDHSLPVIVSDIEQAMSVAIAVPSVAERLMEKFWPGPLTLVVPRHPDFVADLGTDDETIGVRCPDHLVPRLITDETGPLAITTANLAGQEPAMSAQEVANRFDGELVTMIIDSGICNKGVATVLDVTGESPKLLREGQISWTDIQTVLG